MINMCLRWVTRTHTHTYLHAPSHVVVRNYIFVDVSDGTEGVLHQVGSEVNVALHHAGDLVDDR